MSAGVFQTSQAQYAAHRIATFPVGMNKRPAVRGYPRIGLRASRELAGKFVEAAALGFMCGERSGITVLDVDTTDEQVLADALGRHGATPIVVRTASGKWHAWYRHSHERRRIRPWGGDLPIDLLGTGGFVIAPPSATHRGCYQFIRGGLDDVPTLPTMRALGGSLYDDIVTILPDDIITAGPIADEGSSPAGVSEGRRNNALFAHCMRHAHHCDDRDTMIDMARTFNERCVPPLSDGEVIEIVDSARSYTARGENRFGMTGSWLPTETVRSMAPHPYLCTLVNVLQAENRPNRTFWVADGLAKRLGWPRRQFVAARREAISRGFIEMISKPSQGHPALYRFGPKIRRGRRARARVSVEDSLPSLAGLEKNPIRCGRAAPGAVQWKQCNGKRNHDHPRRPPHAPLPPPARGRSTMRHGNAGRAPTLGAHCMWFPRERSAAKSRGSCRRAARLSERMGDASI
jgi:Bifunctional DNA primase/polymerase, N-terminal/Primase C terminal 1 (PriCT-1)